MEHNGLSPSVRETRTVTYPLVMGGPNASLRSPFAIMVIQEVREADRGADMSQVDPEYGYTLTDMQGNIWGHVDPGYLNFFIEAAKAVAKAYGNGAAEDAEKSMGGFGVLS